MLNGSLMQVFNKIFTVKESLNNGKPCLASLGPTMKENLEKVKSYSFPDAEKYIKGILFVYFFVWSYFGSQYTLNN